MYKKLKNKKNSREYEWYFLRYVPSEKYSKKKSKRKNKRKKRKKTKKRKRGILKRFGFGGRRKTRKNK